MGELIPPLEKGLGRFKNFLMAYPNNYLTFTNKPFGIKGWVKMPIADKIITRLFYQLSSQFTLLFPDHHEIFAQKADRKALRMVGTAPYRRYFLAPTIFQWTSDLY